MSTDYRYTIRRKADGKKIAVFYYNMIKNLYDVVCSDCELKLDPEAIRTSSCGSLTKYTIEDINSDIERLEVRIKIFNMKIYEKKMLLPACANVDIKDSIESDISDYESTISNCMHAIEALAGLKAIVHMLVEDQIAMTDLDDEASMAYVYNAKDLPKTKEGYDAHLWVDDVYVEAEAMI